MESAGTPDTRKARLAHAALLAVAFLALNAWGLDWGWPSFFGWAYDELLPGDVVRGIEAGFAHGWHERYPPLHYYLLGALDLLVLRTHGVPARNPLPADVHAVLFLLQRGVSLLMGAGTVALVYLCASRLYGRAAGGLAVVLVAGMPTLCVHTRLATLDVPYLFWWALSLLFALRALERPRQRDLLGFGLAAALAVTTKDQAYGLYLLAWPAWLWLLRARARRAGPEAPRPLAPRDVALPLALALAVFALVHRLPGNVEGFRAHVALIVGAASQYYRQYPRSLAGELGLAAETVRQVALTLGLPAFALGLAGLAWAARRRFALPGERLLLASGASYYLSFLCVVLYSYDRFVLPLCLLLAICGAGALASAARAGRTARRLALAVAVGLVAFSLARALATGRLLARDTRYAAERWLHEHTPPAERVAFVGGWKDLPRPAGLRVRSLPADVETLRAMRPRYVVCNLNRAGQVAASDKEAPFYLGLRDGRLGYALVWRWREPLAWPLRGEFDALAEFSNLFWANPEIAIYERFVPAGSPKRKPQLGGARRRSSPERAGSRGAAAGVADRRAN